MFAILLSDKMDPFYQNISSFPTVIFTFFLILSLLFWSVAVLGLIDIGFLDVIDVDGGILDLDGDGSTVPDGIAGLILKMGLNGVPITIIITSIALFGWFFSYYGVYFSIDYLMAGPVTWLVNALIFIVALLIAIKITGVCIRPIRPLFKKMQQHTPQVLIGQTAVVRTSRVDESFGEAVLEDGGAGLILKVRALDGQTFTRNDKVVLLEYIQESNSYCVISEEEFNK
ncbi:MAG: DUF1449 domain-containing protein [Pseudomonadales bacterium]|nr:DUF1449 domain-containing protein [Pseudomonadales bacterium]